MADRDIVQNMISQLGQSQDDRLPPELDARARDFVGIDERSADELLAQARALAGKLRYYRDTPDASSGDWSEFFPEQDGSLLLRDDGNVPPHLGLFAAFLGLYRYPQQSLNGIVARHMDFQFRDMLRFVPKPARPDKAHLLLELKKNTAPIAIAPDCLFSAGKGANGSELLYRPVRETVIGHGKVAALHSVFHDRNGIFFAPVANSADGLGGALDETSPKWRAFGGNDLPSAHLGCAFSSPVLRMREGTRTAKVVLSLSGIDGAKLDLDQLSTAFEAYVSGPKGWLGPLAHAGSLLGVDGLSLSFSIDAGMPAVVDYDPAVHGHAFAAQAPVLQLLLKTDAVLRYDDLRNLTVQDAQLFVTVRELQSLVLENDEGGLNPKKAFLPFGSQPAKGSRFMIGCEEALTKQLTDLKIRLSWLKAPGNLAQWYAGYTKRSQMNDGIGARLVYQDRGGKATDIEQTLLKCANDGTSTLGPKVTREVPQPRQPESKLFAFLAAGSIIGRLLGNRFRMETPIYQAATAPQSSARSGYITITLAEDFLHEDYRKETVYNMLNKVLDSNNNMLVLNEPYTPKVQSIALDYDAHSDKANLASTDAGEFAAHDLQFFHVGCFGQRREHAFLRAQLSHVRGGIPLLPEYPAEGEFLVGIGGVAAGDSLSLLLQVAEDSADPALGPEPVAWSVLCDNYWRPLTPQNLTLDTSNNLRASGIVATSLPRETSTDHSWMPSGKVWLRAAIEKNSGAACRLLAVAANALEVQFAGDDTTHLSSRLAPGKIAKLKTPRPEVKSVAQPYAGFGGQPQESGDMLTRRAAERLRHRNRCITPWDYERMLLESFPGVHKVKCIPHASDDSWLAPGHVMLVTIPDLRNLDTAEMREPRVDIDTLSRMQEYLQQHAGMYALPSAGTPPCIRVRNPLYQQVSLDFKVRFMPGLPFNHYYHELQQDLLRALMPWAYDRKRDIEFGGRIYRSVLLDFVEELPYVDFVTDFRMGIKTGDNSPLHDVPEIAADRPDVVFTSSAGHTIAEYTDA